MQIKGNRVSYPLHAGITMNDLANMLPEVHMHDITIKLLFYAAHYVSGQYKHWLSVLLTIDNNGYFAFRMSVLSPRPRHFRDQFNPLNLIHLTE